ncbi:MAG: membrane protein insertion efficiency factor YidD [Candidatus Edwardsbacteria bacterium]|jgi:hypothetical protein|nr:membrane protein insertion efficiency factor YidD [Candidatus Edwardsbacteria bacterium]
MRTVEALLAAALRAPIRLYQVAIGPLFPRVCRFQPTCSAYALDAIDVHGPFRGLALSAWRLLRCHPFHPGGYDPVPPRCTPNPIRCHEHGDRCRAGIAACSAGKKSE